jgi:hypothetical protein
MTRDYKKDLLLLWASALLHESPLPKRTHYNGYECRVEMTVVHVLSDTVVLFTIYPKENRVEQHVANCLAVDQFIVLIGTAP